MIDGPKPWPPKNTALVAQPKATRSIYHYLSLMMRRWGPYHHHTMRQVVDNSVWIKRQLKANTKPPHLAAKSRITQLTVVLTTSDGTRIVEQDTQDRSMDREDMPRHAAMAIYLDVTNLVMCGLKAADGLHQSYVAMRPDIEAPHTLFASLMK